MGEPWAMIVLFVLSFLGVVWCGEFFIYFFLENNRAQIIVFGRFGGPGKGL